MLTKKNLRGWEAIQYIHLSLSFLIICTVGLLFWQHYGMNNFLRLDPLNFHKVKANDDREDNQLGRSIAKLTTTPDYWRLDCQLNPGHRVPYCSIDLDLSQGNHGIDISKYDKLTIHYRYQEVQEQIVLLLINFNPAYSASNDYRSQKFNQVFLPGAIGWSTNSLAGNQFNVASWWITDRKIPPKWTHNEFSNIREIHLTTGRHLPHANRQIDLAYIELSGKYINKDTLQLLLLLAWGGSAALWLAIEFRRAICALQRSTERQQHLESAQKKLQEVNSLLAERSMHDPLTLALNREGLNILLSNILPQTQLSIIFIDIDHFKKINDNYGHGIGDQVLCQLVDQVQQQIRPDDKLIRLGGEEFILLCQNNCLTQAVQLAEKLRIFLCNNQSWPAGIAFSCSFGVSERQNNELFKQALHRADKALYRAKAKGRNRVEIAE
ncbi:GGDEF domain-containing protein [Iodobacter sp. LRB]|uniref:GGDEF domain-containing protein n=1 Tax=unclassified Iodobacter TaxID=235634 RepID=UPI000C105B36|nr:GGDEF domain-containing protein [Iodobacter sp. BJB302]PHU99513.1 hypothetical protein CSQ88_22130 [Iodobacter sp. BJB302]